VQIPYELHVMSSFSFTDRHSHLSWNFITALQVVITNNTK